MIVSYSMVAADFTVVLDLCGDRGAKEVKALCYKSEGRWFDLSHRTMALGSTQPLTEMSTRRISWR